ncbi:MAG TPA: hypothetical protein VJ086_07175, partial [Rubrobacteraceae bacterium]|nr:hypothetical protein [Rubrobacteraceae bacterium]
MNDRRRSPDTAYTSDLQPEHVERLRRWHEEGLHAARTEAGIDGQTFDYLGLTLYVPPQVQPIYPVSRLLGETVLDEVRPGDRVLDMGCGAGRHAFEMYKRGADVVAFDQDADELATVSEWFAAM